MEEELSLKELIITLWKNKLFILIITIIFLLVGIYKYKNADINVIEKDNKIITAEEQISATESFILGKINKYTTIEGQQVLENGQVINIIENQTEQEDVEYKKKMLSTFNEILKTPALLSEIISELKLDIELEDLEQVITLTQISNSDILRILVKYDNEQTAINIVNKLVEKLERELERTYNIESIIIVEDARIISETELQQILIDSENVDGIDNAITGNVNNSKSKLQLVIYPIVGFVLSCGLIVIVEIFSNTVKNEKQLEKYIKLKNLTSIKKAKYNNEDKFKLLRVNINECKTILITSSEKKSGKTYVATNLARSFARLNKKVVLIDLERNSNSLLEKYDGNGLLDYLQSNDKFVEKYVNESNIKNLGILPIGKDNENITELLESPKMKETLATLERLYDVVIIDSQNVLDSANTLAIAKIAKYSILVVAERKTKLENIKKAKTNIEDVGGNVIGTVFNKLK